MAKIPVTIVTGFLGSGKTTLITNLLKHTPDKKLAVLVNEFGEVSIDGALLRTAGEGCGVEIHDLPNGCICCTVRDDFLPTMRRLQARKHEVDHVLIETSGLALPTPVMQALAWPEIRNDFQLDAVLTVVDTPELLAGRLEQGQTIPGAGSAQAETLSHEAAVDAILLQQLENADVVILNKIDELDDDSLMNAEKLVRSKATKVRFLELAYHAELDTRLCMGLKLHDGEPGTNGHGHDHEQGHHHGPVGQLPGDGMTPLENQEQFDGHAHSGAGAHTHGEGTHEHFHEHDTGWQSFVLHSHAPQDAEKLKAAVKEAALREPILRAKGFAVAEGKAAKYVLQAVRSRVQGYFSGEKAEEKSQVVFIGYHPNRGNVERILRDGTGTDWH
jgi:cobalamin biosynthesis protein CobW